MALRILTTSVLAAALVAGCSSSGPASVSRSEVEKKATSALTAKIGTAPKSISCPKDLPAEKGASERCLLTAPDGTRIGMTVSVSSVTDGTAHLDFQVDQKTLAPGENP